MTTAPLLERLASLGVDVWADEGRLLWRAPTGVVSGDLFAQLRDHRCEILQALEAKESSPVPAPRPLPLLGRCRLHVDPSDWHDEQVGQRIRTSCKKCGTFIGYRPLPAMRSSNPRSRQTRRA